MSFPVNYKSATAYRRQKQIEDCLYANLQQRPYTSVSISDLCHQLEISRKSFYNYFPDKDSCFRAIISRKLRQCILHLTAFPENTTREERIAAFLNFWKSERTLLDVVVRNNLLYLLMDQCILFFRNEDRDIFELLDTEALKNDEYVLSIFVTSHITMILHWYLKGFEEPVEEIVSKYKRIIYEPLMTVKTN